MRAAGSYSRLTKAREGSRSWEEAWRREPGSFSPEAEWEKLEKAGVRLLLREDPAFPRPLLEIPFPPFGIYVRGEPGILRAPALAIVGTRRISPAGQALAKEFAKSLARTFVIVSGLAFGADAAAHEGALLTGSTVAVLAGGLHAITPRTNRELGERIARKGAVISEYPLGLEPLAHRFLERNRIVAGLARGILIVEAPLRSGSLATARFALEQNREVFVLPGPARDPNFAGSHRLIRQGAELVTSPEEILESLGVALPAAADIETRADTPDEALVLSVLKRSETLNIDKISELTNLRIHMVSQAVTALLLKDLIREKAGGYSL